METNNNNTKLLSSFKKRETDTTLLETHVRQNSKRTKRKVIDDKLITPQVFDLLVTKVYASVENIYNIKQKDVIEILRPMHISNKTIARVINSTIPYAKATQGSVASMIRFLDNQTKSGQKALVEMLTKELEKEFE